MNRSRAAALGLFAGWAIGLWEGACISGFFPAVLRSWDSAAVSLLTPIFIYGLGGWLTGWLLGTVLRPLAERWAARITALAVLGTFAYAARWVYSAYAARVSGAAPHGAAVLVAGGVLAGGTLMAAVYVALRLHPGWPRRVQRGGRWSLLYLPAFLVLALLRTSHDHLTSLPPVGAAPAGRPNIVLVNWDTVRADTLPLFGGDGLDMPNLERLAAEGVLFENFQAVAPITGPSHASMLSGLYPPTHGLRSNNDVPPLVRWERLPQVCAAAGYATGGFVSGYPLRAAYRFDLGFQAFDDRPSETLLEAARGVLHFSCSVLRRFVPASWDALGRAVPGKVTLERALHWYERTDRPAFLWVHFYDAHHPYTPPAPFRERALARAGEGPQPLDPAAAADWVLQRGEIEQLDALLGELLAGLEKKDPGLRNTIVALAADHGECFGEGGLIHSHHKSLYAATQRVVGLIRPAGAAADLPRGVRIAEPASQVDLMPTLCELAGLPVPEGLHGRSLAALLRGQEQQSGASRGLYMEAFQRNLGDDALHGWYEDGWKYVLSVGGREQLFHEASSEPLRDRAAQEPERLARLRAALRAHLAAMEFSGGATADESGEGQRALNALGYAEAEDDAEERKP